MKTTVEIADGLLQEAKACAAGRGVPLRNLVEEGLRAVVERERAPKPPFKLRDGRFKGGGGMAKDLTWAEIRDLVYEGRGGAASHRHDRG